MVSCCVNPACRTEFKLLNTGDLYALERRSADTEFFWLCSACVPVVALGLDAMGGVSVRPRSDAAARSYLIWTVVFGWLLAPPWNVSHGIGPTAPTGRRFERIRAQSALFIMRSRVKPRDPNAIACQKESQTNANSNDRIRDILQERPSRH